MIRDNIFPAARWRIPPESDEIAAQRVSELCGFSLSGLTFSVYASIGQLSKALEEGAGWRVFDERLVADSGSWSKIWTVKAVNKEKTVYKVWLWQSNRDVTVLCAVVEHYCGNKEKLKKLEELQGE